jgi:hypothetical protein
MCMYGVRMSLEELSPTLSNISKGSYCRDFIFLSGCCSLSLFRCNQNLYPTLNVFLFLFWSCLSLYFLCGLFSVSCTWKWIFIINKFLHPSKLLLWFIPTLLLDVHIQHPRVKVKKIKSEIQKVTYQQKCGPIFYNIVVSR